MNDVRQGIFEAVWGIIGGILISTLLKGFAQDGLIPSNIVILFTIVGFLAAIVTMFSFQAAGIIFTLGWIFGAFMLKDLLTPFDFTVYLVAPIVTLVVRAALFFRSSN